MQSKLITNNDKVFYFETKNDSNPARNLSYYGWEFNVDHFLYNYIMGYKHAAKATFAYFLQSISDNRIDVQDTICYPLVFLYRHITELYLKYIFVHLFHPNQNELSGFISNGHDLKSLWNGLKDKIIKLSARVDFDVDIDAIEHYISELIKNDSSSFVYRYPIDKKGAKVHLQGKYLDIKQLNDCMESFYRYLDYVICCVEEQWIDDEYDKDFEILFDETLRNSHDVIYKMISYLRHRKRDLKEDRNNDKAWLQLSEIESDDEIEEEGNFLSELSENQKTLFILLYLSGRTLNQQNLAVEKEERRRDIYKLLYNNNNADWAFNSEPSNYKDSIFVHYIFDSRTAIDFIQRILGELKKTDCI